MKIIALISLIVSFVLFTPIRVPARGQVAPPPRFLGGNVGGWMGNGGSGPIFGFDDPYGIDFPWGGGGGPGTEGFTGYLDGGDWIRGGGGPFSGGGGGTGGGSGDLGCPGKCQSPSLTGPCIPLCFCRPYYHGYPGEGSVTCDNTRRADWNGKMCYILYGDCPK